MASVIENAIRGTVTKGIGVVAEFNRKRMPDTDHPFLTGIHKPMPAELTLEDLPVTGTIPTELDGRYLRIGPKPRRARGQGLSLVHRRRHGPWHRAAGRQGRYGIAIAGSGRSGVEAETGMPHAPGPRHGGFDTVNTNVLGIGGRTWSLVEAGSYPVELSDTLDEQTYNPFDDTLMGSFTAHPHLDPATGEHHAICYEATVPDQIRHVVIDAGGKVTREVAIPVKHGPSIHDCAITARYRDDPRSACHLFDESADRRAQLSLSLESRTSGPRRPASA